MFTGRAYREGFERGCADAQTDLPKRPTPPFWRSLFSRATYATEYIRGYHAGYSHDCREQATTPSQAPNPASATDRHAELERSRAPSRDRELEHSR